MERMDDHLLYKDLTYTIIGLAMGIHKELGPIHKELIYQEAFAMELIASSISYLRESRVPVLYKNKNVGVYIPDFIIESKIIIEIKALNFLPITAESQLSYYLKCTGYRLGLLLNFGASKL